MPKRVIQQRVVQQTASKAAGEKFHRVEMTLAPARDVPIQWANKVIVNFSGLEFFVNVIAATPDPWTGGQVPTKVEGKVLARYVFSVPDWDAAVESFSKHIERLKAAGAFSLVTEEVESEEQQ